MSGPGAVGGLKRARLLRSKKSVSNTSTTKDGNLSSASTMESRPTATSNMTNLETQGSRQDKVPTSPFASNEVSPSRHEEFPVLGESSTQGLQTSNDQNVITPEMENKRLGRGPARGDKLNKEVNKHGKFKIAFLPGETIAMEHDTDLTTGIGIIVRTSAEIHGVSSWEGVSDTNKEFCNARLSQWFDILDRLTDRVEEIIDGKFQKAYTRWRHTLHVEYKKLMKKSINLREVCPRKDLTMVKWQAACDFIEDAEYQKRSRVNSENRAKMPFNHTSGRIPMLCRYREMEEKSEIELFKTTRVSKKRGCEFVNPLAKSIYEDMVEMRNQATNEGQEVSEAEIVKAKLGYRSGYVKGMGHGVQVLRTSNSYNVVAGTDLKAKLIELDNAKEQIVDLSEAYEEQSKTLENQRVALEACEEKNKTYSEEIDILKIQMSMMKKLLEKIPSLSANVCQDLTSEDDDCAG